MYKDRWIGTKVDRQVQRQIDRYKGRYEEILLSSENMLKKMPLGETISFRKIIYTVKSKSYKRVIYRSKLVR